MSEPEEFLIAFGLIGFVGLVLLVAVALLMAWLMAVIVYPRVDKSTEAHRLARMWAKKLAFPVEVMAHVVPILAWLFFLPAVGLILYPILGFIFG